MADDFTPALEYRFRAIEGDLEDLKRLAGEVPETSRLAALVVQRVETLERELRELKLDIKAATTDITTVIRANRSERIIRLGQIIGPTLALALGALSAYFGGLLK